MHHETKDADNALPFHSLIHISSVVSEPNHQDSLVQEPLVDSGNEIRCPNQIDTFTQQLLAVNNKVLKSLPTKDAENNSNVASQRE